MVESDLIVSERHGGQANAKRPAKFLVNVISAHSRRILDHSAANLKKGLASAPIALPKKGVRLGAPKSWMKIKGDITRIWRTIWKWNKSSRRRGRLRQHARRVRYPDLSLRSSSEKKKPRHLKQVAGFWRRPTLAQPIAVLPSGLQRFTAVFGMGTGGWRRSGQKLVVGDRKLTRGGLLSHV
jgi:hypothetical protein